VTTNLAAVAGTYPIPRRSQYHPLTSCNRGVVQNIRFENFFVQGSNIGPEITQDSGNNGSYSGTSLMEISNVAFVNFTGYTTGGKGNQTASISCSKVHLCYNITLRNISLASAPNGTQYPAQGTCSYTAPGGVSGMNGAGCM